MSNSATPFTKYPVAPPGVFVFVPVATTGARGMRKIFAVFEGKFPKFCVFAASLSADVQDEPGTLNGPRSGSPAEVFKKIAEATELEKHFIRLLTKEEASAADRDGVGKLKLFEGVRNFPVRVKCASLAWHTLNVAMAQQPKVSTE